MIKSMNASHYLWDFGIDASISAEDIIPCARAASVFQFRNLQPFTVRYVRIYNDVENLRIRVEDGRMGKSRAACFPHLTVYLCMERELE